MDINKRNLEETKAKGEQKQEQEQEEDEKQNVGNNDSSKLILLETKDHQQF